MTARKEALIILEEAIIRVDRIVVPWGFQFELIKNDVAHLAYACGQYKRGNTEIELIYRLRRGWGAINYQVHLHTKTGFVIEKEVFGLGHPGLMRRLGHENDSHLIESDYGSVARGGGDPIEVCFPYRSVRTWTRSRSIQPHLGHPAGCRSEQPGCATW